MEWQDRITGFRAKSSSQLNNSSQTAAAAAVHLCAHKTLSSRYRSEVGRSALNA
ncbi:hypothetical protein Tcan_12004 [Toxocara canis]|uniref:Uncharacterized protein n=1 Tax=Toxocara canis TaxID=6265 RepID=A0A0B2UVM9_TOXCA|nr:hypothetical protein Tcan_12004 [Toxocara canis]